MPHVTEGLPSRGLRQVQQNAPDPDTLSELRLWISLKDGPRFRGGLGLRSKTPADVAKLTGAI